MNDIITIIGVVAFSIGWVWLIVTAFQKGGILWGILTVLFGWISGLVFCIMKKTGWTPLVTMIVGMILIGIGFRR